ncbi:MAG: hypothetical protein ABIR26_10540 [Ramlibacter sp.]
MKAQLVPKNAPPIAPQVPNGGSGQGSDSALDAMLRKRREVGNQAAEHLPEKPEGEV